LKVYTVSISPEKKLKTFHPYLIAAPEYTKWRICHFLKFVFDHTFESKTLQNRKSYSEF
jgi:hypothetical protein